MIYVVGCFPRRDHHHGVRRASSIGNRGPVETGTAFVVGSVLEHRRPYPPRNSQGKRAEYGEEILQTPSAKLVPEYGQGYSKRNLARMIKLAEVFPDQKIITALSRQLGWSHFVEIIPIKDLLKREFYAEMCRVERWSVHTLRQKIGGMPKPEPGKVLAGLLCSDKRRCVIISPICPARFELATSKD